MDRMMKRSKHLFTFVTITLFLIIALIQTNATIAGTNGDSPASIINTSETNDLQEQEPVEPCGAGCQAMV